MNEKIYAALFNVQQELEPAVKDRTNPAFRSKYADLQSVWDACAPALKKYGILVMQNPVAHHNDKDAYLETKLVHIESGEWVTSTCPLILGDKQTAQALGSAITYARRYSLMAMLGIIPEDDDGNAASNPQPPKLVSTQAQRVPTSLLDQGVDEPIAYYVRRLKETLWNTTGAREKFTSDEVRAMDVKTLRLHITQLGG